MQSVWDPHKTALQNLGGIGVLPSMNTSVDLHLATTETARTLSRVVEAHEAEHGPLIPAHQPNPKSIPNYVNDDERAYLRALQEKHGDNYKAMERDIRANYFQWSAKKLATRLARLGRYESWLAKQAEAGAGAGAQAEVEAEASSAKDAGGDGAEEAAAATDGAAARRPAARAARR